MSENESYGYQTDHRLLKLLNLRDNLLTFKQVGLKCGKCLKKCRVASNSSSRRVTEEVGEPDLIRRLTQDNFKLKSVNLCEPRVIVGESLIMSAISTETAVGTPTLTGDMTKSKVAKRITPTQEKSKVIAIKEDAITSKGKDLKLPRTSGKAKGKSPTSARKTITMDPNIPSCARGFYIVVHVFLADSQSMELGEAGTVVPLEVTSGTDA
uniref:Integrase core domain containing protein n=1 Tax=Solanum tuberosum TaxID=4113 RepID=M1DIR1_SOLTU